MTAINQGIITSYEVCGLSPEEIAAQEELEVESVKAVLLQFSVQYRKVVANSAKRNGKALAVRNNGEEIDDTEHEIAASLDPEPEITEAEYRSMWDAYKQIALYSEVDSVRERALRFALEEKKGRNSARVRALAGVSGNKNVLLLNKVLRRVKELGNDNGDKPELPKIIDVEATPCSSQKTETNS